MTLVRAGAITEAYANWSRWVAHCGHCQYGREQLQPCHSPFRCRVCGGITEVVWPTADMIIGVERLLMMRPDPSTRNWFPGETLNDLLWENGAHGIFDNLERLNLPVKPGDTVFAVEDTRIRVDNLPQLKPRIREQIGT